MLLNATTINGILVKLKIVNLELIHIFDKNGSSFTKTFPPVEIYQIIPECDKFDEDKYVKKYMEKYGIDNVRGGTYSRLELTQQEKTFIQKELWGANNLCFECGGEHFIKDCPNNKHPVILQSSITENNYNKKNEFLTNFKNELFELTEGHFHLLTIVMEQLKVSVD